MCETTPTAPVVVINLFGTPASTLEAIERFGRPLGACREPEHLSADHSPSQLMFSDVELPTRTGLVPVE